MYLALRTINNKIQHVLCQTTTGGDGLTNRDLICLGDDPGKFIKYPGGSSFYIDELVFDQLELKGVDYSYEDVEKLFLPFLEPWVKTKIAPFCDRHEYCHWKPMGADQQARILAETHIFDRRRLHYLRFGQLDQQCLDSSVLPFRELLDKSRDEIEQFILNQEKSLSPYEYKSYVVTVFDLQRFFSDRYARNMPHLLNRAQLDKRFVEEICRLDKDTSFWRGMVRGNRLPVYMINYVIMYFDHGFSEEALGNNYSRSSTGGQYRPPAASTIRMSMDEASTVFGLSRAELADLSKKELHRIYRQKAQELHPDKGGNNERFIELTNAYNEILHIRR